MNKLKGFLFDMDGVVVDNYGFHFQAWMEFSRKYSFPLDAIIYRENFNGKTNADLFKMIFGNLSDQQIKIFAEEKEMHYQRLYSEHISAHKGLVNFLDFLHANNFKVALGTSAPTFNVDFTLDRLGLRKYFHVIVDGPQVTRGKPDPEVYSTCAAKLNLEPKECVVFEDSLAGLMAGRSAGCEIVGVATSHTPEELKVLTSFIVKDFTEVRTLLGI